MCVYIYIYNEIVIPDDNHKGRNMKVSTKQ